MFGRVANFFKEMRAEFTKVSWPNREELTGSTTVVIVSTILLAAVIGIWDFAMTKIISIVLK